MQSEDQNGLDGSYIDCYMNEHQDVSAEDAQRHVAHLISCEWKRLNREILTQNQLPSSFRMVPLMYHYRPSPVYRNKYKCCLINADAAGLI